jgi:hypothetical protein
VTTARAATRALDDRLNARRLELAAVVLGATTLTAAVAAAQGGYFPTAWGWTALALLWIAGLALVLSDEIALSREELVFLGLLGAFVGWSALSIAWSASVSDSVAELERTLVYAAGFLAFILVARRGLVIPLLGSFLAGITGICAYSLSTRLFPDTLAPDLFGGYRLSTPIGYWNGLGLLAAMGILLAIGFAASECPLVWRALAAASLPLLAVTLYFTYSRGGWVALAVGFALVVALDPRRLRLVTVAMALAAGPVLAVALSSQSSALTRLGGSLATSTHEGRRLSPFIVLAVVLAAVTVVVFDVVERRVSVPARLRRAYAVGLLALAVACVVVAVVRSGGPVDAVRKAYGGFTSTPAAGADLNDRLFHLSSSGRTELWHLAWKQFESRPLVGTGGGTYTGFFYAHRTSDQTVKNAHSLYLETLGELGVIGTLVLVGLLAVPFAGVRSRARPLVPASLGAYAALLAHALIDWDWELPALFLVGTWCGLAALVEQRDDRPAFRLGTRSRGALLTVVVCIAGFSFVALVGNMATSSSGSSIPKANWTHAARQARRAAAWNPWAARPYYLLAQADLGLGRRGAAVADLRRGIERAPQDYTLWEQLAIVARGAERREALRRLHELNPRSHPNSGP